jgi:hypothetical protein
MSLSITETSKQTSLTFFISTGNPPLPKGKCKNQFWRKNGENTKSQFLHVKGSLPGFEGNVGVDGHESAVE